MLIKLSWGTFNNWLCNSFNLIRMPLYDLREYMRPRLAISLWLFLLLVIGAVARQEDGEGFGVKAKKTLIWHYYTFQPHAKREFDNVKDTICKRSVSGRGEDVTKPSQWETRSSSSFNVHIQNTLRSHVVQILLGWVKMKCFTGSWFVNNVVIMEPPTG